MVSRYKITYAIVGEAEITATSKEEAEAMFWRLSKRELAEEGELQSDEPQTDAEREALDRAFQIAREKVFPAAKGVAS